MNCVRGGEIFDFHGWHDRNKPCPKKGSYIHDGTMWAFGL